MKLICFPHAGGFAFYFNFIKQNETLNKDYILLYDNPGWGYQASEPSAKASFPLSKQWQSAPNLLEVKIFLGTHFYMREQEVDFLHYIQKTREGDLAV